MRSQIKFVLCLCTLLFSGLGRAQGTDSLEISLLTCGAGPEVYALYGHTALRVRDLEQGGDFVFNYGTFNMNAPYFIPKFTLGLMDYELGGSSYQEFAYRYSRQGIAVTHQVLNLMPDEARRMLQKLQENYQPENREYRYNFIYDNCSTRPRDILEASLDGQLVYRGDSVPVTYRQMLHRFNEMWPWSELGVDLVLGAEADRILTLRQQEFLPSYLMDHLAHSVIRGDDGRVRPVVKQTFTVEAAGVLDDSPEFPLSPMQCALLLLGIVLALSLWEILRRRLLWGLDLVLFLAQGLTGVLVFILFFFSDHPTVGSNWLILLFNPIPLFYLPVMIIKGIKHQRDRYHLVNVVFLTLFILFFKTIPQDIPLVVVPLALTLWVRSVNHLLLCKK